MVEEIVTFEKMVNSLIKSGKACSEVLKKKSKIEKIDALEKALKTLSDIQGVDAQIDKMKERLTMEINNLKQEVEKERALIALDIVKGLEEAGFRVDGHLPLLYVGPFSLEIVFGLKPICIIWFGPKKEKLGTCQVNKEEIISKVLGLRERLYKKDYNEEEFLRSLFLGYRIALLRNQLQDGSRVKLTSIMAEIAFIMQKQAFLCDAKKENYTSYGRVEFAIDLSRLTKRQINDRELRLDVATLAQTKKIQDYIWVPHAMSCDGVHFSTMYFARA